MPDAIVFRKVAALERSVARARAEYAAATDFKTDYTHQDAAVLNVQRACEAAIDLAYHTIRERRLEPPVSNAEAFQVLSSAGLVEERLADSLRKMVSFRNIAVHQYQQIDLNILESVIRDRLQDLLDFATIALQL